MNCPLCKENQIESLEIIKSSDLIQVYQRNFKTDVSHLIKEDLRYCECKNCTLRFFDPPITGDERFYNFLQPFDWYYVADKEEFLIAKDFIVSGSKVLEVGSGAGTFAQHVSGDYIGLDFSVKAKEMAAKNGIKIENSFIQDYASNHANEFDVVVSFQVLEHVADPDSFLTSMTSALKVGGRLILAVPSEDSFIKHATNEVLNLPPHHVTRWNDKVFQFIERTRNLKLLAIHHESLQSAHYTFFLSTMFQRFFKPVKLVDTSLKRRILTKISDLLAKLFVNNLSPEFVPKGHTVLVVFEKV